MKIIEISPVIGSGSVGRIVDQIYSGLVQDGHECKIICGKIGNTIISKSDYIPASSVFRRRINALIARLLDNDGFCPSSSMSKIVRFIEDVKPDIIHIHGAYGYYLDVRPLYKLIKQRNILLVNTMHSCWDYTGHCCYYTFIKCKRWMTGCYNCPEKHSYPMSIVFDNSKRNYRKKKEVFSGIKKEVIVTPSRWLAEEVKRSFLAEYPIRVINNGIDTNTFRTISKENIVIYEKYEIPKNKIIILGIAGIWDRRKGLEDFIELDSVLPDDMQIVIVGVNEKQRSKLPQRIIGICRTENIYELAELYSIAAILFNPTYEDNYPTVNLEAIACGTPVVTYGNGGSGEAVTKYEMGEVIGQKDYKAVMTLAKKYYGNKPILDSRMHDDIDAKRMVGDYIDLFCNLL